LIPLKFKLVVEEGREEAAEFNFKGLFNDEASVFNPAVEPIAPLALPATLAVPLALFNNKLFKSIPGNVKAFKSFELFKLILLKRA